MVAVDVAVDACLDAGGRYDSASEECIFTVSTSDTREPRPSAWIDWTSLGIGGLVSLVVLSALLAIDAVSKSGTRAPQAQQRSEDEDERAAHG